MSPAPERDVDIRNPPALLRAPLFFLIFFVLGFVGGVLNVYRTASKFIK
jgi:hypothetical protein